MPKISADDRFAGRYRSAALRSDLLKNAALAVLTPAEMAEAERAAFAAGIDSFRLMLNAGSAVATEVARRFGDATSTDILCGPGNNGGDGYVVATILAEQGWQVRLWAMAPSRSGSDAERARALCPLPVGDLSQYRPVAHSLVIDALFGGGLSRPLSGEAGRVANTVNQAKLPVLAIDMPSGVDGATGRADGPHFRAAATLTFMCPRSGHLLYPGRGMCGDLVVADIGLPERFFPAQPLAQNAPSLWQAALPLPSDDAHKYSRGHVAVFSGGPTATGAARLSALAAARAGAGAVTMLSPPDAMAVNAAHLTSIMLREAGSIDDALRFVAERKVRAIAYGPGLEPTPGTASGLIALIAATQGSRVGLVIDASAITALSADPLPFFAATKLSGVTHVLTPHEGEFSRLFPDLAADPGLSKVDRARAAARQANSVIVYKGPDTVIAGPDGRAAINTNGTAWLATAGSGDVLAGLIAGLRGQEMTAFEAACAAVWIHAEAGARFGPGLVADDLPGLLPPILKELLVQ